ncbi:universal stress protein [Halopenitus persicus]|uniref:Nucleotide-binding universal stress protein, UspA family n=1 Tax=Halopenitus persicus TaxID=1048396 RepID=A0A1H3JTY3_9EURY|nr:universal stress protein [Halopenitus persicus]SDY43382.1 Nucleotide-binding universal stress protein, UspA family [Halopenitus persicus]
MYDDILVPVDDSEPASTILGHVTDLASWADATIQLLFVADTGRHSVTVVENEVVDGLVRKGTTIVEDVRDRLRAPGIECETDVVQGTPATTIVEYADRYDHDLIVMSTHGRTGVSRYLRGSVSEAVVRRSPVPVLTARMQPDERLTFPYEDVLIPTDGSPGATRAVRHGVALADSLGATVHALSVVEEGWLDRDDEPAAPSADPEQAAGGEQAADPEQAAGGEQAAGDAVEAVVAEAETHGVTTTRHVADGNPADVIFDRIDAVDADVVVMGTTGRRGADRVLLGSVAERTVRDAPVPVLTVGDTE